MDQMSLVMTGTTHKSWQSWH